MRGQFRGVQRPPPKRASTRILPEVRLLRLMAMMVVAMSGGGAVIVIVVVATTARCATTGAVPPVEVGTGHWRVPSLWGVLDLKLPVPVGVLLPCHRHDGLLARQLVNLHEPPTRPLGHPFHTHNAQYRRPIWCNTNGRLLPPIITNRGSDILLCVGFFY